MHQDRLSTGILGLDQILHGGLIPGRAYLVRGRPGTGKTTLDYISSHWHSEWRKSSVYYFRETAE